MAALSYDEAVITFFGKTVSDVTSRAFIGNGVYFDASVLELLGDQKAALAEEITELKLQADQFQYVISGPSFDFEPGDSSRIDVRAQSLGQPWIPGFLCVSDDCPRWDHATGLVESLAPAGHATVASAWFPFCAFDNFGSDLTSEPLVFLAQVLLTEAILKSEELFSLVIAAVATLLSRLRTAIIPSAIAVSQRSFFTHHGSHPPTDQSLGVSGLLSGRGFQLTIVA